MKRRDFVTLTTAAAALGNYRPVAGAEQSDQGQRSDRPLSMVVGTQRSPTTPEMLEFIKRHGVDHICGYPPNPGQRGYWTVEDLERTRDLCERHGITLDMVALPFLSSSHIDSERRGAIMLADSPERDRDIDHINKMTAACAKAGIPAWKYNMSLLGVLRTERTSGRGGSTYSTWRLGEAKADSEQTRAGRVTEDLAWERITYFLDRVIPVCNEHKIRAACHPHDPGVPPEGYQGIARVLGTVAGLKKFASIQDSPFHGFNLCLGTAAEMMQNPRDEIHELIRYFGQRKKIFNIHFRNIRGRRDSFQEVWPDEGDMDMFQIIRTLHEVDYPYMVMPDHLPHHHDDPGGRQGFAFCYGYIKALIEGAAAGA